MVNGKWQCRHAFCHLIALVQEFCTHVPTKCFNFGNSIRRCRHFIINAVERIARIERIGQKCFQLSAADKWEFVSVQIVQIQPRASAFIEYFCAFWPKSKQNQERISNAVRRLQNANRICWTTRLSRRRGFLSHPGPVSTSLHTFLRDMQLKCKKANGSIAAPATPLLPPPPILPCFEKPKTKIDALERRTQTEL